MTADNSSSGSRVDVVVIGGGAVGENVAGRTAAAGLDTVLVENSLIGGECSYWACMPSKALLHPGTALAAARSLPGAAEAVTGDLDAREVLARRNTFTSNWDDASQADWVRDAGIRLIRGTGTLTAPRDVQVRTGDGEVVHLHARFAVVLATGSYPTPPPIPGLDTVDYWTTREATSAQEVPQSLAVVGGGVAGTELAQAWARLGARVTLLARHDVLGSFPEPARALVKASLEADGVDLRLHCSPTGVRETGDGISLSLDDGDTVVAEKLLVATGRTPALAGLGLEKLIEDGALPADPKLADPRHGVLVTDPSGLAAGTDWLYAVGDAAGKVLLTHQGKYEARAAGSAIAARARGKLQGRPSDWSAEAATADERAVPQVVFTDPEVAQVGLDLPAARAAGFNASETALEIDVAGAALLRRDYSGWASMVVDEDRHVVLGMCFAGPGVSELLHAATIAVVGQVPLDRLWHAVPAYPTVSEVWLRLLEKYGL